MFDSKRALALVLAFGIVAMFSSACDRTITRVETVQEPANCFACHSDQNTFIVAAEEQWKNSVHASSLNIDRGASSRCSGCHTSEGFVQRANGATVTGHDNPTPIHCFTCHAPHTEGDFGLRWTSVATLKDGTMYDLGAGNLCAACHQARRDPAGEIGTVGTDPFEIPEHFGPHHGNQADMLIGTNGYEFAGFNYDISRHRSLPGLEDGCVGCHFNDTSNSVVGGHSFNMKFALRTEGGDTEEIFNTAPCEDCHGDPDDPILEDFNIGFIFPVQDSVKTLVGELEAMLVTAGLWENGHPKEGVATSVDSAGAVWNLVSVEEDRSFGVHNARYTLGLLESSIMFLEGTLMQARDVAEK